MVRFLADEIEIRREPEKSGRAMSSVCGGKDDGSKREEGAGCTGKRPLLLGPAVEAACVVFLGKLKQVEDNPRLRSYRKLDNLDQENMRKSMEAALKAYLRLAGKNALDR